MGKHQKCLSISGRGKEFVIAASGELLRSLLRSLFGALIFKLVASGENKF